ncbi:MAG: Crp/Fnr family transcriptional regulator [Clostridia bacterium]|nr:Crp/Fnr family transcriptional regulator [Clostridia bacterium]
MNILEKYPKLKNNVIFKNASEENIRKFITEDKLDVRHFSAGDDICSPEQKEIPVSIIIDGTATVSSADCGRNVLLKTVSAGAIFGIATLYSAEAPFPTIVKAKTTCSVLFINAAAVRALIENDRAATVGFMEFLSNRIVYLNKKINSFTAGCAERRLSLFLADNESDGIYSADVSISALADMLDIARASLYRAFDKLEAEGFIEKQDKIIIIKDKQAMLEKYFR